MTKQTKVKGHWRRNPDVTTSWVNPHLRKIRLQRKAIYNKNQLDYNQFDEDVKQYLRWYGSAGYKQAVYTHELCEELAKKEIYGNTPEEVYKNLIDMYIYNKGNIRVKVTFSGGISQQKYIRGSHCLIHFY